MRIALIPLLLLGTLSVDACRPAFAATPDANNPAQCLASFYWLEYQTLKLTQRHHQAVWHLAVLQVYNASRLKTVGVTDLGKAESTAFLTAHYKDWDLMFDLAKKCAAIAQADPFFRAHEEEFATLALKVDPACKKDATVCTN